MKFKLIHVLLALLLMVVLVFGFKGLLGRVFAPVVQRVAGMKTVADRVEQFSDVVQKRLAPDFERVGVAYPPKALTFVGLKDEKVLEVWVAGEDQKFQLLKSYPILGASGVMGPKLKEGDMQVPEGIYKIESLNPNSMFHLSLRVNYPNEFDREMAQKEGRGDLGGDIMIHGNNCSVGCLAMGDEAAEELFILAAETGIENIAVILSPIDFRTRELEQDISNLPGWTEELYVKIKNELSKYK